MTSTTTNPTNPANPTGPADRTKKTNQTDQTSLAALTQQVERARDDLNRAYLLGASWARGLLAKHIKEALEGEGEPARKCREYVLSHFLPSQAPSPGEFPPEFGKLRPTVRAIVMHELGGPEMSEDQLSDYERRRVECFYDPLSFIDGLSTELQDRIYEEMGAPSDDEDVVEIDSDE